MFATAFEPFFTQTFAFIKREAAQFTNITVDENATNALGLQKVTIFVDDIIVNVLSMNNKMFNSCYRCFSKCKGKNSLVAREWCENLRN